MSETTSMKSKFRVFCYGDSLTAGMNPDDVFFPYAAVLQKYFDHLHVDVEVQYKGLSGWMAEELIERDATLANVLKHSQQTSPIDLVIILAGTNDLGRRQEPLPQSRQTREEEILDWIWKIHSMCHESKVKTIAISVPGSYFQYRNRPAAEMCGRLNSLIKSKCESDSQCTYVECPITFTPETTLFSNDGLHFSKEGYSFLAKTLVPVVLKSLGMEKEADEFVISGMDGGLLGSEVASVGVGGIQT